MPWRISSVSTRTRTTGVFSTISTSLPVLVKDDPELQAQFVDDLAKMAVIERALGAARQREAMQDVYGAWEELQQLPCATRRCSSMTRS